MDLIVTLWMEKRLRDLAFASASLEDIGHGLSLARCCSVSQILRECKHSRQRHLKDLFCPLAVVAFSLGSSPNLIRAPLPPPLSPFLPFFAGQLVSISLTYRLTLPLITRPVFWSPPPLPSRPAGSTKQLSRRRRGPRNPARIPFRSSVYLLQLK